MSLFTAVWQSNKLGRRIRVAGLLTKAGQGIEIDRTKRSSLGIRKPSFQERAKAQILRRNKRCYFRSRVIILLLELDTKLLLRGSMRDSTIATHVSTIRGLVLPATCSVFDPLLSRSSNTMQAVAFRQREWRILASRCCCRPASAASPSSSRDGAPRQKLLDRNHVQAVGTIRAHASEAELVHADFHISGACTCRFSLRPILISHSHSSVSGPPPISIARAYAWISAPGVLHLTRPTKRGTLERIRRRGRSTDSSKRVQLLRPRASGRTGGKESFATRESVQPNGRKVCQHSRFNGPHLRGDTFPL